MSGASPQLAAQSTNGSLPKGRSPLAHLLHALNQPLTGLQCSLELAVAGPRRPEQYVRTLNEGLELTSRMRALVEAIRELMEVQATVIQTEVQTEVHADVRQDVRQLESPGVESFALDELVRDTVADLLPVAESKRVHISLARTAALPLRADRRYLATMLFRWLESAVSLAQDGSDLRIVATFEQERARLIVSWIEGPPPEHSPFSCQELGLLIAQAGWEHAGAEWMLQRAGNRQTSAIQLPRASALPHGNRADWKI